MWIELIMIYVAFFTYYDIKYSVFQHKYGLKLPKNLLNHAKIFI